MQFSKSTVCFVPLLLMLLLDSGFSVLLTMMYCLYAGLHVFIVCKKYILKQRERKRDLNTESKCHRPVLMSCCHGLLFEPLGSPVGHKFVNLCVCVSECACICVSFFLLIWFFRCGESVVEWEMFLSVIHINSCRGFTGQSAVVNTPLAIYFYCHEYENQWILSLYILTCLMVNSYHFYSGWLNAYLSTTVHL